MVEVVARPTTGDGESSAKSRFKAETRIEGTIPPDMPVRNNQKFLFISKDQQLYTHGLHKYPAKFFPELPRWLIERYSEQGECVLDPFMGSGTTNLEASLLGRNSIGIDVDLFSRFLAKVKTTPLPNDDLKKSRGLLEAAISAYGTIKPINGIPKFPYRDNWFKPYILQELSYIRNAIDALDTAKDIRDFFQLCFSSIIRAVSEADNNCTRTVVRKSLGKTVKEGAAIKLFLQRLERNTNAMIALINAGLSGSIMISGGDDARHMPSVAANSIDLALTSPPYMNAVDYPRTHQLEMYWLGFASGSLTSLKKQHVGTEAVTASDYRTLHKTQSRLANLAISKIYEQDQRRAYIASKYIQDMQKNMEEVYRVLKPGKRYVVVVGNNFVRGVQFESWRYLKQIAPKVGYKVEKTFVSGIINHFIKIPRAERINDDHVLVLKK